MTADGEPFCMALVLRATVRQLRLHACACMRLEAPKKFASKWLKLLEVAERYADAEADGPEFAAARTESRGRGKPRKWGGDLLWAFQPDDQLRQTWNSSSLDHTFQPADTHYHIALFRYRVFEELLGPDPPPRFSASWSTDTAVSLARTMYKAREFSAMPILADALQDAGCDSDDILNHCRDTSLTHVRGCWVVDLVLGKN